jgi:hypothetical protein
MKILHQINPDLQPFNRVHLRHQLERETNSVIGDLELKA